MSVVPYAIRCYRDSKWIEIQTDKLLPGDVVSIGEFSTVQIAPLVTQSCLSARAQAETTVPADVLLINGTVIVNEAMLSGESTPLLKESIQLREGNEPLDVDTAHRNTILFSGTKILQATPSNEIPSPIKTPDGGCLGVVLRTGFGTSQGQLVRTMIFSTERVSANNLESFLFIGFLLIFALAASWYVWTKGTSPFLSLLPDSLIYRHQVSRTAKRNQNSCWTVFLLSQVLFLLNFLWNSPSPSIPL